MTKARDLANAGTALTTVSATELGYLDGVTSAVQTQINSKIGQSTAINPTIVDAKGDIIAATAADTVARLAVGSNDTVLTADSSTATGLKWATPSSGGMTLLSTTTFNNGTATQTVSSIPGGYTDLRIICRNMRTSGGQNMYFRFNGDTASNYFAGWVGQYWAGPDAGGDTFNNVRVTSRVSNSTAWNKQGYLVFDISNYTSTTQKIVLWNAINHDGGAGTGTFWYTNGHCIFNTSSAITSFNLNLMDSTWTSGTVEIWGIK